MTKPCAICSTEFDGRKDRRWCSTECRAELKRQYDRERYPEIRDETVKRACDWQRENRYRKQAYDNAYRKLEERRIKKAEHARAARLLNPEPERLRAARRRARRLGNGWFKVTIRDLERMARRYDMACGYCQSGFTETNPLEWDHVIPVSRGGRHSIGNLIPACRSCNRNKQVKFVTEWRAGRIVCVRDVTLAA